jgi:hypothetical protein
VVDLDTVLGEQLLDIEIRQAEASALLELADGSSIDGSTCW